MDFRVAVVGAGIAGLTVAAALARSGIRVDVYEQAESLREVGAGIQLSPNATGPLARLGLGESLAEVATRPEAVQIRRWDSGDVLLESTLGTECEREYGAAYLTVHRADLHRQLLQLVPAGWLHVGSRCVAVRETGAAAELRFADGSTVTADLVIGADGIHSAVRALICTDQPRFSGQTVYRGLAPGRRLPSVVSQPRVRIWLGPGQHCVYYPIAGGRLVSFVATVPADDWRDESWTAPAEVPAVVAAYQGWNAEVTEVLAAAERVTRWALHDRDPTPSWSTDRVTLVGDAAHPMLPFGAQGAAQAVEDAVALAACLRPVLAGGGAAPAAVAAALRRYEQVRQPRTAAVQQTMRQNARNHHYDDGAQQQERDRSMQDRWSLRGQAWLYGYDAEQAVTALHSDGPTGEETWTTSTSPAR